MLLPLPIVVDADVLIRNVDYVLRCEREGALIASASGEYSLDTMPAALGGKVYTTEAGEGTALYAFDVNLFLPVAWVLETIYTIFLLLLSVHLTGKLDEEPSLRTAAALGITLGLASLFRSTMVPQIGLSLFWLFSSKWRKKRPASWKVLGTAAFAFVLTLTPWTIRNHHTFGKIIPVSQNLGINLWQGWNPTGGGSEYALDGSPMPMTPDLTKDLAAASTEPEWDAALKRAAFRYASEDPIRWLKQRALSFLFFWHEHNFWAPKSPYRTTGWLLLGAANIPFVLLFFIAAAWTAGRRGYPRYLLAVMGLHCLIHTLTHADIGSRYRYQIEPIMLILIALFLSDRLPVAGTRLESFVRRLSPSYKKDPGTGIAS